QPRSRGCGTVLFCSVTLLGLIENPGRDLVAKDHAEHAVILIGDASVEEQPAIREDHSPETIELERNSKNITRRADETTVARIVGIDPAIPEIADPEGAIHDFKAPRGVQSPLRNQSPQELTLRIENIDKTEARAGKIIIGIRWIDLRISHENLTAEITDSKWRVASGEIWIGKWKTGLEDKASVVGLDVTGMKIRHVKVILTIGDT